VAANGINAARNDHRFPPLREDELEGLEVEVSVLTPPRPIASYEEFRVGEEGVILEKDGRSAVFLPEVAVEQGWDRDETLTQLARKAGLPGDGWKTGASFQTFRSQKFSAPYSPVSGRSEP
jgi:AmmeMemoRadiSam system protein A